MFQFSICPKRFFKARNLMSKNYNRLLLEFSVYVCVCSRGCVRKSTSSKAWYGLLITDTEGLKAY